MISDQNSSTHTPININTFNMKKLRLDIKRQSIFNKLKSDNGVIIPETHSTPINENKWKKQ